MPQPHSSRRFLKRGRTKTLTLPGKRIYTHPESHPRRVRMNLSPRIGHCLVLIVTIMVAASTRAPALQAPTEQSPDPPCHHADPGNRHTTVALASGFAPVPDSTTRHLGMAGLGLMASALGVLWTRRRRVIHRQRRRYLREARFAPQRPPVFPIPGSPPSPGHSPPRHRIRRFDYDRFYLHLLRDL